MFAAFAGAGIDRRRWLFPLRIPSRKGAICSSGGRLPDRSSSLLGLANQPQRPPRRRQAAYLLGLAPFDRASGQLRGTAPSAGAAPSPATCCR